MNKRYRYCFKEKKLVEIGSSHENSSQQQNKQDVTQIENITLNGGKVRVETKTDSNYRAFNDFFLNLPAKLSALNLSQKKYKAALDILKDLVIQTDILCTKVSENPSSQNVAIDFILKRLKSIDSAQKLKSEIKKNVLYTPPDEVAIALNWKKPKFHIETQIPSHTLKQSTFQFVSPIKTLTALFLDQKFKDCYMNYNLYEKHKCTPGIFRDFCCGSVCKNNEVFNDPLSLKIQLGTDDFEVCCALKSKANKHKMCATYMQIKNMPFPYRSKLDNIHLVALCNSSYLKSEDTTYDYIAEKVVRDLKEIENRGILVDDRFIKGSLINHTGDNLGLNTIFGYTESFSALHYCRHCECTQTECQKQTRENKNKMRTKESYERLVDIAESLGKIDLKKTKGIKRGNKFNELKFFHTVDNVCVDLMHDFNEGVILYCLHDFFNLIIANKILTVHHIQRRVRDFNYSQVSKEHKFNVPSLIVLEKHNLNQCASQIYCLMIHMPFIFHDIQDKIQEFFTPIKTLLECMQVTFSDVITESDINNLECRTNQHLESVKAVFKRNFTAKMHFLVHYPENIRKLGPPINFWTMRMEAKHKVFTEIAKTKKNFINPAKTMAEHHQEQICKTVVCNSQIEASLRSGQFSKSMQYFKFEGIIVEKFGINQVDILRVHKFANYCGIHYREGNFIITDSGLCRITHILSVKSKVMFICEPFEIVREDDFCVSLVVQKMEQNSFILDFSQLENKIVCHHVYVFNEIHIISNKLCISKLLK